jgi:hypothetical protein
MPALRKDFADHHDAEIVLKLYELRREPVMRDARHAINSKFFPRSIEEVVAVTKTDHPLNAAFRQTSSYWEMAYALARHGVVQPEFMLESCGEGLYLFAKVRPFLAALRESYNPDIFRNAEWIAESCDLARSKVAFFTKRIQATVAQ